MLPRCSRAVPAPAGGQVTHAWLCRLLAPWLPAQQAAPGLTGRLCPQRARTWAAPRPCSAAPLGRTARPRRRARHACPAHSGPLPRTSPGPAAPCRLWQRECAAERQPSRGMRRQRLPAAYTARAAPAARCLCHVHVCHALSPAASAHARSHHLYAPPAHLLRSRRRSPDRLRSRRRRPSAGSSSRRLRSLSRSPRPRSSL